MLVVALRLAVLPVAAAAVRPADPLLGWVILVVLVGEKSLLDEVVVTLRVAAFVERRLDVLDILLAAVAYVLAKASASRLHRPLAVLRLRKLIYVLTWRV